ncbi:proline-serine-threonine phosphatase-interacting protein 1 [Pelomyxa schiedti]|nr:proline-serine-threonine phosphatase-interacting protein 1 [Pelomyxa schiedti]
MSKGFPQTLLDGFETLDKRTLATLRSTKQLGSFFKHLSEIQKEYLSKMGTLCTTFKQKKLPLLDFTVQAAMSALVTEMEGVFMCQNPFVEQLIALSKEVDTFVKEREKKQKLLMHNAHKITKDWKTQLDTLKKTKENYVKLTKDANAQQTAFTKKEADGTLKAKAKTDAETKLQQAKDKAKAAEDKYTEVLGKSNEMQAAHYETEQPNALREFQQFEEERITFVKDTIIKYVKNMDAIKLPEKWDKTMQNINSGANSISVAGDISSWCEQNATGVSVPEPILFESWDGTTKSVGSPSIRSSKPSDPAPAPASTTPLFKRSSEATSEEAPKPKRDNTPAATAAVVPGSNPFDDDEPAATPAAETTEKPKENSEDTQESGDSEGTRAQALYDYTPTNDKEMAISEGDVLFITEQDDSGWWYARMGDKEGFVPAEYVKLL